MNYRSTPTSLGSSPGELLMNRKIRTHIPTFSHESKVSKRTVREKHEQRRHQMEHQFNRSKGAKELPELQPGTSVLIKDLNQYGTVIRKRMEPRSYEIRLNNGGIVRRNRKGLRALPKALPEIPCETSTPQSTPVSTPAKSTPSKLKTPSPEVRPTPTKIPSKIPHATRSGRETTKPSKYVG